MVTQLKYSVVVPIYEEEENISILDKEIKLVMNKLSGDYEIIYINDGSNDIYLVKDAPIPSGSSLQVLDGGAKFVVQSGDALKVISDTASSLDCWVSAVDAISS